MNKGHGLTGTRTYKTWQGMKSRCLNPNAQHYSCYGGRGITVCAKWLGFDGFLEDMGIRPEGGTLERIDNNKGYSKENCRWATRQEQAQNRRHHPNSIWIAHGGLRLTLSQWAVRLNLSRRAIRNRLSRNLPTEMVLASSRFNPGSFRKKMLISFHGKTLSVGEWSTLLGVPQKTIRYRLKMQFAVKEVLSCARRKSGPPPRFRHR